MNTQQEQRQPGDAVLAWCLGSFHTALTMLVFVAILYRTNNLGGAINELGTMIGLLTYGLFWLATAYHTSKALHGIGVQRMVRERHSAWIGDFYGNFLIRGGLNGITLWLMISVPILALMLAEAVSDLGTDGFAGLAFILTMYWLPTAGIAWMAGALVGVIVAAIDEVVLLAAGRCFSRRHNAVTA